jgi:hypothetical protein
MTQVRKQILHGIFNPSKISDTSKGRIRNSEFANAKLLFM